MKKKITYENIDIILNIKNIEDEIIKFLNIHLI